jgi:hypothetical protein
VPKPIPPPPPQPSRQETQLAVRWVYCLAVSLLCFWGLNTLGYHNEGFFVGYGRTTNRSWLEWKMSRTEPASLRNDGQNKIIWLVGSSILREAIDETKLNEKLKKAKSSYRVLKLTQARGTPIISHGLIKKLAIEQDDELLVSVAPENFKKDWLNFTGMTPWFLSFFLDKNEMWAVSEYGLADKLEQWVAVPTPFFTFHYEYQGGVARWLQTPIHGVPQMDYDLHYLKFRNWDEIKTLNKSRRAGKKSRYYLSGRDLDFSEHQVNAQGVAWIQAHVQQRSLALTWLEVPSRPEYRSLFMAPEAQAQWNLWKRQFKNMLTLPQQPNDHYYDMKHPNFRGRFNLTHALFRWILSKEGLSAPGHE